MATRAQRRQRRVPARRAAPYYSRGMAAHDGPHPFRTSPRNHPERAPGAVRIDADGAIVRTGRKVTVPGVIVDELAGFSWPSGRLFGKRAHQAAAVAQAERQ